jgi:hypothetical protein
MSHLVRLFWFLYAWRVAVGAPSSGPSSVSMTVNGEGRITGNWSDSTGSGSLTGTVRAGGDATLTVSAGDVYYVGNGVTAIGQDGTWTGSLPLQGEPGMALTFQVVRQ